jgi:hypothetical protein
MKPVVPFVQARSSSSAHRAPIPAAVLPAPVSSFRGGTGRDSADIQTDVNSVYVQRNLIPVN